MTLTEKGILARYPLLYEDKNAPMSQTAMCWGLDVGKGWLPLIDELSAALEKEIKQYKKDHPDLDCATCGCPKEEHHGYLSPRPGKCLTVIKKPTRHKWRQKIVFNFKFKWLANLLTWLFSAAYAIENKIRDTLFWKYRTCWCEKYRHPHPRASQVKSKFGGLRFYMTYSTDKMEDLIREAERKSETICELCGEPGEPRGGGWIETLCDKCNQQREPNENN
jgi:hypothetical protein